MRIKKIQLNASKTAYLEHVLHVISGDERVVDANNLNEGVFCSGAHHQTANATEAVDADFDGATALASRGSGGDLKQQ